MSVLVIIALSSLLLLAYVFDITSSRTKIPSVILMLFLGGLAQEAASYFKLHVPPMGLLLPLVGTLGLILIVLEGALSLKLSSSGKRAILLSVMTSLIPMIVLSLVLALIFHYFLNYNFRLALLNVIPLTVISSSMSVTRARNEEEQKDLAAYESNLSDIFGVLFFNFVSLTRGGPSFSTVLDFVMQLVLILIVSFVATVLLSVLLNKISHPIKFTPIILLVVLIYGLSKLYDLPAMLFILFFGLFLGNLERFREVSWIQRLRPDNLAKEAHKLKDITTEATFLIRALFFLLFGFLVNQKDLTNISTLGWSAFIVAAIFGTRALVLRLVRMPLWPSIFAAPGGLITILLFFAIDAKQQVGVMGNSLVLQVIVLTSLVMMLGMILGKPSPKTEPETELIEGEETPTTETTEENPQAEV